MWSCVTKSVTRCMPKKKTAEVVIAGSDFSDDETSSNASIDEGLECPICLESFNIVENVPYILWCGHTLCKNCVLGLRLAALKFSTQHIQIPFFVFCPWCNILTFRWVYKGIVKFPRKNFFLLWMVESRNGDRVRVKTPSSIYRDHQLVICSRYASVNHSCITSHNRRKMRLGHSNSGNNHNINSRSITFERSRQTSFHKSLDFIIRMLRKLPLVVLLLIVIFALPASATILMLYVVVTFFFALPAILVLYFACPALNWLRREIRT